MFIEFDPSAEDSSLGKYLKSVREEKEVTIEDLAEVTRIKQQYLEAIEDDRLGDLPTGPYLTLFLKSYCEALEISYDELTDTFQVDTAKPSKPQQQKQPKPPKHPKQPPQLKPVLDAKKNAIKPKIEKKQTIDSKKKGSNGQKPEIVNYLILTGVIVFIAFIALIILVVFRGGDGEEVDHAENTHEAVEHVDTIKEVEPEITPPPVIDSAAILREQFLNKFDKLELSIHPKTQQAMMVIADSDSTTKLVNSSRVWNYEAEDSLVISCEKMDESEYYINGYRLKTDSLDFAGANRLMLNRQNWLELVDTTDVR